jgi:hypothetical protein
MSLSLDKFKDLLGPLAERLTEEQITGLYDAEHKLANAIFELWLRKRNTPKHIAHKPEREDTTNTISHEEYSDER